MFRSLGQLNYLSCLQFGRRRRQFLEWPSLRHRPSTSEPSISATANPVGRAESVIDCGMDEVQITMALNTLYSDAFLCTPAECEESLWRWRGGTADR